MKTLHHHAHLAPHELEDIKQTIEFCRANTMRRVSVLGYAQMHCPNAYQEYIDNANKWAGIAGWFNTHNYDPNHLKHKFEQREKVLNERINNTGKSK